jgi:Leucine-rich repeat (LRR) protein
LTSLNLGFNRLGTSLVAIPLTTATGPIEDAAANKKKTPVTFVIPTREFTVGSGAKRTLQTLSLRSNGFNAFPEDFLTTFPRLRELDLSFNQIQSELNESNIVMIYYLHIFKSQIDPIIE